MRKRIRVILIMVMILLFAESCTLFRKLPTLDLSDMGDKYSIKGMYAIAEEYVHTYIDENYELLQLSLRMDEITGKETAEFVYTKRTKSFRDGYFIKFDIANGELSSTRVLDVNHYYGAFLTVLVDDWIIDTSDLLNHVDEFRNPAEFAWDNIWIETANQNVWIRYSNNAVRVLEYCLDPFTNETISTWK